MVAHLRFNTPPFPPLPFPFSLLFRSFSLRIVRQFCRFLRIISAILLLFMLPQLGRLGGRREGCRHMVVHDTVFLHLCAWIAVPFRASEWSRITFVKLYPVLYRARNRKAMKNGEIRLELQIMETGYFILLCCCRRPRKNPIFSLKFLNKFDFFVRKLNT